MLQLINPVFVCISPSDNRNRKDDLRKVDQLWEVILRELLESPWRHRTEHTATVGGEEQ